MIWLWINNLINSHNGPYLCHYVYYVMCICQQIIHHCCIMNASDNPCDVVYIMHQYKVQCALFTLTKLYVSRTGIVLEWVSWLNEAYALLTLHMEIYRLIVFIQFSYIKNRTVPWSHFLLSLLHLMITTKIFFWQSGNDGWRVQSTKLLAPSVNSLVAATRMTCALPLPPLISSAYLILWV